ncbi:MAG: GntR family transcriptional regulator [Lachnospiraceae bacterium]
MTRLVEKNTQFGSGKLLYSRISDRICEHITEHKVAIGEKLPSERVLSNTLGVSRNSVREAIRELENQGILRVEAGRGSFLIGEITDRAMLIKIKKHNFFELFEIKTVLEEHIIKALVPVISKETLEQMESIARQMIVLSDNGIFPQELDDKFHELLLEPYWNKEMLEIVQNMLTNFAEYNNSYFNRGIGIVNDKKQSIFDTIPLHLKLVECMKKRDAKTSVEVYRQIIEIDINIYSLIQEL